MTGSSPSSSGSPEGEPCIPFSVKVYKRNVSAIRSLIGFLGFGLPEVTLSPSRCVRCNVDTEYLFFSRPHLTYYSVCFRHMNFQERAAVRGLYA